MHKPEQEALLRSLAAVMDEQAIGWLVADVADVLGMLLASAMVSYCEGQPRYENQFMMRVGMVAREAAKARQPLKDRRQ